MHKTAISQTVYTQSPDRARGREIIYLGLYCFSRCPAVDAVHNTPDGRQVVAQNTMYPAKFLYKMLAHWVARPLVTHLHIIHPSVIILLIFS
jgi:hypothetical protein